MKILPATGFARLASLKATVTYVQQRLQEGLVVTVTPEPGNTGWFRIDFKPSSKE